MNINGVYVSPERQLESIEHKLHAIERAASFRGFYTREEEQEYDALLLDCDRVEAQLDRDGG